MSDLAFLDDDENAELYDYEELAQDYEDEDGDGGEADEDEIEEQQQQQQQQQPQQQQQARHRHKRPRIDDDDDDDEDGGGGQGDEDEDEDDDFSAAVRPPSRPGRAARAASSSGSGAATAAATPSAGRGGRGGRGRGAGRGSSASPATPARGRGRGRGRWGPRTPGANNASSTAASSAAGSAAGSAAPSAPATPAGAQPASSSRRGPGRPRKPAVNDDGSDAEDADASTPVRTSRPTAPSAIVMVDSPGSGGELQQPQVPSRRRAAAPSRIRDIPTDEEDDDFLDDRDDDESESDDEYRSRNESDSELARRPGRPPAGRGEAGSPFGGDSGSLTPGSAGQRVQAGSGRKRGRPPWKNLLQRTPGANSPAGASPAPFTMPATGGSSNAASTPGTGAYSTRGPGRPPRSASSGPTPMQFDSPADGEAAAVTRPSLNPRSFRKEREAQRKRLFSKEMRVMMYGFGDSVDPQPESADLLEDVVLEYIGDLCKKASVLASSRGQLQTEDFINIIRRDPKKYGRVRELLVMHEEIKRARRAVDEKEYERENQ
ncbi:hypothetical protein CAOG_04186 [Capsaspora owczarzaki ATCC 30864]|uniref:Transcription initiation factor TFIID subunit 13 n=1 Tax=Capsaspora owczarzaki (strain ATCC 30864) TaxID=595528 RepID=A0A0D2WQS4_CAPO3|nr:hypothetical protein CAOG_04186 [Capsaspora owczarzaki ATCC 30864]KJE93393.1 hypothetical protein CAOG_004186 [Capsaspora owczarzaki ATCC 30864]|eukprot:XP_004348011.1 hypothetical protein CAOG_04186 [Capsaspora owczarzaki ATCC 30864]